MRRYRIYIETANDVFRGVLEITALEQDQAIERAKWDVKGRTSDPITTIRIVGKQRV